MTRLIILMEITTVCCLWITRVILQIEQIKYLLNEQGEFKTLKNQNKTQKLATQRAAGKQQQPSQVD